MSNTTVTIKDIAQLAGVSDSTVSRVLNDQYGVSEKTKKKVLAIVENKQYLPNNMARCLVTGNSNIVAFVTEDIRNPFFAEIARGVEDAATAAGYRVIICSTDGNAEKEKNFVNLLAGYRASGIVFSSFSGNRGLLDLMRREGIAFVFVNRYYKNIPADWVVVDNKGGAVAATSHLIQLGHTRIAHIGGGFHSSTSLERKSGYEKALTDNGIAIDSKLIVKADLKYKTGYEKAKELLNNTDVSAFFLANDLMALGAWQACMELSRSVPDKISLVGFDDIEWASFAKISLTTVRQPKYDVGRMSFELLENRIESSSKKEYEHIVLPTELIVRASTAPKCHK